MKILIAGDWHSELHEEAIYQVLRKLGHEPIKFAWNYYFWPQNILAKMTLPLLKAQNKYMIGPSVNSLNNELVNQVKNHQPNVVFIYRGSHIYANTLKKIRVVAPRAVQVGYNNDDPFSPFYPKWKWRHFIRGVQEYDLMLSYREHNIKDYFYAGAKRVELLRSWFIPERNHPVQLSNAKRSRYECDVVFVGHYEKDGRLMYLEDIVRRGWKLKIFGPGYEWNSVLRQSKILKKHVPVRLVWGEDYNQALCGAKIALCFLSKLNRDTYTRRCFEIPASGTILMSEYSDDLANIFKPESEAIFFKNREEFQKNIELLLNNSERRKKIADAGRQRVWEDGHDVVTRMENVIGWVDNIIAN